MNKQIPIIIVSLFLILACLPQATSPQEKILKQKDVPEVILKSFGTSYPKAKIKGFSKEFDSGKTYYEIESIQGKVNRDILYNPDGTVVSIEESMPFTELPTAVRDTIKKEFPKAKIQLCERLIKDKATQYEVVLKVGKAKYEVVFEPNGKINKKEKL